MKIKDKILMNPMDYLKEVIIEQTRIYNIALKEGVRIGRDQAFEEAAKHIEKIAVDPEWDHFKYQDLWELAEEIRTLEKP